ncbi:MAG: hypothetical protein IKQ46_18890, partial [Bacteroidales bacterium]|nr:hypothetical protein [Bacteroidales bacterium]
MNKVLFFLLLILLNCNLFGQAYYISVSPSFSDDSVTIKVLSGYNVKWYQYLENNSFAETSCSDKKSISELSGIYSNRISKFAINSQIFEIDNDNWQFQTKLKGSTGNSLYPWFVSIQHHKIAPCLRAKRQLGNFYCATDILNFEIENLYKGYYKGLIQIYFVQSGVKHHYKDIPNNEFSIKYDDLCKIIDPTQSFAFEVEFESKKVGKLTVSNEISPILPYVKVDESKLVIVDDKFYYPELLEKQTISFKNIKTSLSDKINSNSTGPYNLGKYYGLYNVIIEEEKRCSLTKSFIYPELAYNYVNDIINKKDEFQFWYEGEIRDAVNLSLYTFGGNTELTNLDTSQIKITPNMKFVSETPKFLRCQRIGNAELYDSILVNEQIYTISTTDKLSKITITGNKDFIPVTRTVKLKSYPNITGVNIDTIMDATCYYDSAVVKVSDIEGGLDNGYKFMLKKGEQEFWSENSTMKIPATIFGGNEQEVKLYVYDKDSISDDTGREKRAFSTNIKFKYGETLDIIDTNVVDLLCFNDNTGKILITDWTPKNDDIKFE